MPRWQTSSSRPTNSMASGTTLSDQGRHPNRSGYRSTGPKVTGFVGYVGLGCATQGLRGVTVSADGSVQQNPKLRNPQGGAVAELHDAPRCPLRCCHDQG